MDHGNLLKIHSQLTKKNTTQPADPKSENALQEARNQRKRAYSIAITFPSYFIFWVIIVIWGLSYVTDNA